MKIFWTFLTGSIGLAMVSCTPFQQQTISDILPPPDDETEETLKAPEGAAEQDAKETERDKKKAPVNKEEVDVSPTPEQQAAAEKLLAERDDQAKNSPPGDADDNFPQPVTHEDEPETAPGSSGIPERAPLRMGQYAPPEEAASVSEAQSFLPNSAEQQGFRSPMLPASLPMDIHGKLTGEDKKN